MEFEEQKSPEFILSYQEMQARAPAGAAIMGSQIEGGGRLARLQEMMGRRQKDTQQEVQFLSAFYELKQQFDTADEVYLKDKFFSLRNPLYKNAMAFLLAAVCLKRGAGNITREGVRSAHALAQSIDQGHIVEEDIIRYCRLLLSSN